MFITVAVCTWNRARLLDQTLAQLCKMLVPHDIEWELLVIDNNCTDETPEVVARYADRLPIRRVVETHQGQSNARNRAMTVARGDLLVWTDDDVLVDEQWLSAYADATRRWPDAGFFGGQIVPWFQREPPRWMRENLPIFEGVLVARDLGPGERLLERGEWPWGANMAFRRTAFEGRWFDPNLGLTGADSIRHDETEYCKALEQDGVRGVWVPSAIVQHFVMETRMRLGYVRKHFEGSGRANVRIRGPSDGTIILGAPVWLYRTYLRTATRALWRLARQDPGWVESFASAAHLRGEILENRVYRRRLTPPI